MYAEAKEQHYRTGAKTGNRQRHSGGCLRDDSGDTPIVADARPPYRWSMTTTQTPTTQTHTSTRTLSIVSLVAGILSIVFGQTVLLPIAAIVLGVFGYRQEPTGRTFSVWGIVLAGVALFGWVIFAMIGLAFAGPWLLFAAF